MPKDEVTPEEMKRIIREQGSGRLDRQDEVKPEEAKRIVEEGKESNN